MKIPIYQIDAFTNKPFHGNPAAVCPLKVWLDHKILQQIAAENNLSETAFFVQTENRFHIRWFTPTVEVDLCGHATLAAAFVIFNYLDFPLPTIEFDSLSGKLAVTREADWLCLDFPATAPEAMNTPTELVTALGQFPTAVFKSRDLLAVFENENHIISLKPNFASLAKLDCLGVIVTAPGKNSDFVSRFFAPKVGINEESGHRFGTHHFNSLLGEAVTEKTVARISTFRPKR